jgi:hypothetical protein
MPPVSEDYNGEYDSVRTFTPALSKSMERGLPISKQEELRLKFA